MKRLSEIGIDHAPWSVDLSVEDVAWIEDRKGNDILRLDKYERKNARFIAAAPKLYEEQYHDCVALRTVVTKLDEGAEVLNLRDVLAEMADRMEAVLAEAAGEEVAR